MPGTLYVVATPIGNLEDVTARALRILKSVAVIAAEDTRRTAHLLDRYGITTPTTSLHDHNETQKAPALIDRLNRGEDVALVSDAGTPVISDPGLHLIQGAISAGIRVEPIPGPSAVMAALSASGLSTAPFSFLGFPPTRLKDRKEWFDRLTSLNHTVVFFEAPHRIHETLDQLLATVGDCPVAICRELTKVHETLARGPISSLLDNALEDRGEITVVLDLGHRPNTVSAAHPEGDQLKAELGQMTAGGQISRRKAIGALARRHQMTPNAVYEAIERAKKSVE